MSLSSPEEELALLRAEVASLKQQLEQARAAYGNREEERGGNGNASTTRSCIVADGGDDAIDDGEPFPPPARASDFAFWEADHPLSTPQVERYCRQMLLPWFGPEAQARLASSSALVVGLGGLGCPAALYLAAAGVGKLGLCDRDGVDVSNLHRQVLHSHESALPSGSRKNKRTPKVESAAAALRRLNPSTALELFGDGLTRENAREIVEKFDVVLDCSDNAPTRYLLSDACCRRRNRTSRSRSRRGAAAAPIPLVSGAAIGGDGQLTVYCAAAVRERGGGGGDGDEGEGEEERGGDGEGDGTDGGSGGGGEGEDDDTPCYRCLFPVPPPAASCGSCAEAGVLGPVPGVVGVLQALEAIKLLALGSREEQRRKREEERGSSEAGAASSSSPSPPPPPPPPPPAMTPLCRRMLAFDGRDARFRTVQLRPRSARCASCGDGGEELEIASFDYEAFTGRPSHDGPPLPARILPQSRRVPAAEAAARIVGKSSAGGNGGGGDGDGDGADEGQKGKGEERRKRKKALYLDVRSASQFGLARIPSSVNVPWGGGGDAFLKRAAAAAEAAAAAAAEEEQGEEEREEGEEGEERKAPVVVVCRRGNDSQRAVAALDEALSSKKEEEGDGNEEIRKTLREFFDGRPALVDVVGGLEGIAAVDSFEFPRY